MNRFAVQKHHHQRQCAHYVAVGNVVMIKINALQAKYVQTLNVRNIIQFVVPKFHHHFYVVKDSMHVTVGNVAIKKMNAIKIRDVQILRAV